jgi:hypothetical protein
VNEGDQKVLTMPVSSNDVRQCGYCGHDIISVSTGVPHPLSVWIDLKSTDREVVLFDSTVDSLHVKSCPLLKHRVVKCNYCPQEIVWLRTATGARHPIVASSWDGREVYDRFVHYTHFADCPKSKELSGRGKVKR